MIDAVRARFRIGFHKRPLAQIHLFFFAQILFRAPNRFFFPEGRPGGVFGNLVLQREKRAIRFEFGGVLLGLAVAEIARLPDRARNLPVVNLVYPGDAHPLAKKFVGHRVDDVRKHHRALVRARIHAACAQNLIRLGARALGVHRQFQIIADGFRLQTPGDERSGDQAGREQRDHFGAKRVVAARRPGGGGRRLGKGKVQVRRRSRAIAQGFVRFEPAAHQARNAGKQERRKRGCRHHRAGHFEIKAVRTEEKQTHKRCVHRVVPDQRREDSPAQHHDSRDDANQPDLDTPGIGGFLRIIAVQKAPKKRRNHHGEPAGLCEFAEKRNGEEAEGEFFVGRGKQTDRRTRNPGKQGVHGLLVTDFLRGPCAQAIGHHIKSHHVADVHGSKRQTHHRRREKLFGTQPAEREGFR